MGNMSINTNKSVFGIAAILLAGLAFQGCNVNELSGNLVESLDGSYLDAKVNDVHWTSPDGAHHITESVTAGILITAGTLTDSGMVTLLTASGEGTYTLKNDVIPVVTFKKGGKVFHSISGKIVITRVADPLIEGTFEAELAEGLDGSGARVKITEGRFATRGKKFN